MRHAAIIAIVVAVSVLASCASAKNGEEVTDAGEQQGYLVSRWALWSFIVGGELEILGYKGSIRTAEKKGDQDTAIRLTGELQKYQSLYDRINEALSKSDYAPGLLLVKDTILPPCKLVVSKVERNMNLIRLSSTKGDRERFKLSSWKDAHIFFVRAGMHVATLRGVVVNTEQGECVIFNPYFPDLSCIEDGDTVLTHLPVEMYEGEETTRETTSQFLVSRHAVAVNSRARLEHKLILKARIKTAKRSGDLDKVRKLQEEFARLEGEIKRRHDATSDTRFGPDLVSIDFDLLPHFTFTVRRFDREKMAIYITPEGDDFQRDNYECHLFRHLFLLRVDKHIATLALSSSKSFQEFFLRPNFSSEFDDIRKGDILTTHLPVEMYEDREKKKGGDEHLYLVSKEYLRDYLWLQRRLKMLASPYVGRSDDPVKAKRSREDFAKLDKEIEDLERGSWDSDYPRLAFVKGDVLPRYDFTVTRLNKEKAEVFLEYHGHEALHDKFIVHLLFLRDGRHVATPRVCFDRVENGEYVYMVPTVTAYEFDKIRVGDTATTHIPIEIYPRMEEPEETGSKPPRAKAYVTGTVTEADTGRVIEDASVICRVVENGVTRCRAVETDMLGNYKLNVPPEADIRLTYAYAVRSSSLSYRRFDSEPLIVKPGQEIRMDIALEPITRSRINGILTDKGTSEPIVGVEVVFKVPNGHRRSAKIPLTTDGNGKFSLKHNDAWVWFDVNIEGYNRYSERFFLHDKEVKELRIALTPGKREKTLEDYARESWARQKAREKKLPKVPEEAFISGTVTDADTGFPLKNVRVTWTGDYHEKGIMRVEALTDENGYYRLGVEAANSGGLAFEESNYRHFSEKVKALKKGDEIRINATLKLQAIGLIAHGTVYGTVRDSVTGEPVAGAYIQLEREIDGITTGLAKENDEVGRYCLRDDPGEVKVAVKHLGYVEFSEEVILKDGVKTLLDIDLVPIETAIEPVVTDFVTGEPLDGVLIRFSWGIPVAATGRDGRCRLPLGPGYCGFKFELDEYETFKCEYKFTEGEIKRPEIKLRKLTAVIQGKVVDERTGLPIAARILCVSLRNGEDYSKTRAIGSCDLEGRFEIPVAPDVYNVCASIDNYIRLVPDAVEIQAGETLDIVLEMHPIDSEINGRFFNAVTREPIAVIPWYFRFYSYVSVPEHLFRYAGSDVKGTTFRGAYSVTVVPGKHRVDLRVRGYLHVNTDVTVADGEKKEWNIYLTPIPEFVSTVTGVVLRKDTGKPQYGSTVYVVMQDTTVNSVKVDENGRFTVSVPAGDIELHTRYAKDRIKEFLTKDIKISIAEGETKEVVLEIE